MEKKKTYYITTPIYYPSGNWHIGHTYTTVICDTFARYHKMLNEDVFFLTGTDEHGQKIEEKAKAAGVTPKQFIDPLVDGLKDIWKLLDVQYDRFIRTTDDDHVAAVQKIFKALYEKGDIYKSEYEGWYCTPCEAFWTKTQLKDGRCPDCGREVKLEKEESYFFRLSNYADRILKLYEDNPEFLQPKSRMNEMVNNFLKPGLQDLCVSRTSVKWGIPVDFDLSHTVYVWIDALSNYITALGYASENDGNFKKYWPADLHMTGKEIIRFHAIIWPAILMALDLPLPKQVYGHGWLLIGGDKLSKSKTDKVSTELTDPHELVSRYGCDCVRYFLLREIPFGSDGVYTNESLLKRINGDLANDLGNLVSRTTAMINQYFGGVLPSPAGREGTDGELIAVAEGVYKRVSDAMNALNAPDALVEIFKLVQRANKYIDETTPWILAKQQDEASRARLGTVMYNLAECIRISAIMLKPFLPVCPNKILSFFGIDGSAVTDFESVKSFGGLKGGITVEKATPLFPRIDVKKELEEIEKTVLARRAAEKKAEEKKAPVSKENDQKPQEITIDDFAKVQLKTGVVLEAEKVEKADKLLKLKVRTGTEERTIVSGIAKHYTPEEMVGKTVIVVANLKPAKLRGILSEGMLLCAEDAEGKFSLVTTLSDVADGAEVR
ncbi:MAG: methionine--tRNA ligase [Clostridia bacterium]|nr:methionine--tRNA ligase [Clostridia bacterium]